MRIDQISEEVMNLEGTTKTSGKATTVGQNYPNCLVNHTKEQQKV